MSVIAVIPARLGATRLPRKPLRLLGGRPLVVCVHDRVLASGVSDRCVVATDAQEVLDVLARYNVPAVLTAANHPSGTDRVAEVAGTAALATDDIILNVQGDEPFVAFDALRGAVDVIRRRLADIGTAAASAPASILARPDVVKVVCTDEGRALYFSRAPIPFLRDPVDLVQQAAQVRQHVGVYAYTPAALAAWVGLPVHPLELCERLEQLRPLAAGLAIGVANVAGESAGGIDTEADLIEANERWSLQTPQTMHTRDR
ncbi:MAG TPA: 3-deoxy-manno-octulosonate cytidylyltransferase [Gemmatimonas sp.]|nr:3-deoxy-manno-octulosonate cytidylyltransferase [Gemmatimonas sp.]